MNQNDLPYNPNTEEFVGLLTSNQRKIFAYIMSLVGSSNDADDILQETTKTMWQKFDEFKLGTDFVAWATTIAYYRVLDFRKRKKRRFIVFDDEVFYHLQNQAISELQDADDYIDLLRKCLKKLTKDDMGLIKMKYINSLAVKEISHHFGRSLQSIYRSIARIHNLLRICVTRQLLSEERK